jgi:hypothetical protein
LLKIGSNYKAKKGKTIRNSRMQSLPAQGKQILLETMPIQPMATTTNRIVMWNYREISVTAHQKLNFSAQTKLHFRDRHKLLI